MTPSATPYRYGLLDPRPDARAEVHNAPLLGKKTLGLEVTVLELAARCGLGNIDPQHLGGAPERTAISECLDHILPPPGAMLVTIRPDLDAFGAMALLSLRANGHSIGDDLHERIAKIDQADRFAHGAWPGVRPLPTEQTPFSGMLDDLAWKLAGIGGAVNDAGLSVCERVGHVMRWLDSGEEAEGYRECWLGERQEMARGLASGAITISTIGQDRMAVIASNLPQALRLGYHLASVVVALNDRFCLVGSPKHRKFTIAQYAPGYLDMAAVCEALNAREPGWGGSATIIGSPQGVGSGLELAEVVEICRRHLSGRQTIR